MNKALEKSRKFYDKKAKNYNQTFDGKFTLKFKEELLGEMSVRSGDAVLDIACGNGVFLNMLSDKYRVSIFGADISEQMIINAKKTISSGFFAIAGCDSIPFATERFDHITVCAAYHHFPDIKAFSKEAKRLLKPGGTIYIADIYLPPFIRQIANLFIPFSKSGDVKIYSLREVIHNFSPLGFEISSYHRRGWRQIIKLKRL